MKKSFFAKLLVSLFIVTETVFSSGCVSATSFRHALQLPCEYISTINECAKSVNSLPTEQLDIKLHGEGIGKTHSQGDSTVYAFKNSSVKSEDIPPLVNLIKQKVVEASDKEFIFTGYGEGANLAAEIASQLQPAGPNQVKVIVFCANRVITNKFKNPGMYLSDMLHFCKRNERPQHEQSSMIDFNMSPTIGERFSLPKCAVGLTALVGTNLLFKFADKNGKIPTAAKLIVNGVGLIGTAALSFSKQPNEEYFSNSEICPRFKCAQSRAWGADTFDEWKHLGD